MRTIVIAGLAVGLATIAPSVSAASAANAPSRNESAPAQPSAAQPADSERQICVADDSSYSRIRRPVCHTAREWIALEGAVPEGR